MTGHIGAEITGADLAPETVAEIRAALLTHKVLFLRGQHLDHAEHLALARALGEPTRRRGDKHGVHPEGFPEILSIDPDVDDTRHGRDFEERYRRKQLRADSGWHADLAFAVNPPSISILRAQSVPPYGGDTHWTNLVAAYDGLSSPLRTLADGLRAEHAAFAGVQMLHSDPDDAAALRKHHDDALVSVHPLVRVHPETGEKVLFTPPASITRILELTPAEGRHLLNLFFEHATRPEYTVRFHWSPGDIAIWDNRATAHLPPVDMSQVPHRRSMYRISLLGDRPVGPDGYTSHPIAGTPLAPIPPR
ncbi:TauD/TfdA dioxygenase family protein [Spirillospora sp. CA-294931]|uniref:TauD/TfdA dioxygenase family protein n=1 Tax=Spirillospora sp. CA-294931 TaxID=3240042 RepID=UPI003D942082